jgi:hypothetical protein
MRQRRRDRNGANGPSEGPLPRARREGVLSSDLGGEIVVYDSGQHRAHCLNLPSAIVWRHLDGRTSMAEMIAHLRRELDQPADEEMVRLALEELDRAGLLEEPLAHPAARKVSRRHALRRLGIAAGGGAVLLPAISSIVAPPVHAQVSPRTCSPPEAACVTFSCQGGCACVPTTEGTTVCVVPNCVAPGAVPCQSSAGCPPGMVCFTLGCCFGLPGFCIPIAAAGVTCGGPVPNRGWAPRPSA